MMRNTAAAVVMLRQMHDHSSPWPVPVPPASVPVMPRPAPRLSPRTPRPGSGEPRGWRPHRFAARKVLEDLPVHEPSLLRGPRRHPAAEGPTTARGCASRRHQGSQYVRTERPRIPRAVRNEAARSLAARTSGGLRRSTTSLECCPKCSESAVSRHPSLR